MFGLLSDGNVSDNRSSLDAKTLITAIIIIIKTIKIFTNDLFILHILCESSNKYAKRTSIGISELKRDGVMERDRDRYSCICARH